MITDQMINRTFIHHVVTAGFRKIRTIQTDVIRRNLNVVTGHLRSSLLTMPFSVEGSNMQTYYMPVLAYTRFLDIHYRRRDCALRADLSIYNRVIWGVFYGETEPTLRYGLTQDLRRSLAQQLEQNSDINLDHLYDPI